MPLQVLHNDSFPSPQRPCAEASSVKSRRSLLDLLSPSRRAPQESNLRNEIIPSPLQKTEPQDPSSRKTPRSILRVIATKFRNFSPNPPISPPPLNAKQNREAALRERGLLPPLKPNQDLSKQEAQRDLLIPAHQHHNSTDDGISAADLIKQEWEARNKYLPATEEEERDRLNNFTFGGSSTKLTEATELQSVTEINAPHPTPSPEGLPPPVPTLDGSSQTQSHPSNGQYKPNPLSVPSSSSHLPTPPPTPHNPTSISSGPQQTYPPPSLHCSSHPNGDDPSSTSTSSNPKTSTSESTPTSTPTPPPANPIIKLRPPSQLNNFYNEPDSYAYNSNRKSDSISQMPSISESVSSIVTPSLDTSSQTTTTISTLNTSESLMNNAFTGPGNLSGVGVGVISKGKNNLHMLKVKTHDQHQHMHNNIHMIAESPVEDSSMHGDDETELKSRIVVVNGNEKVNGNVIVEPDVIPEERGKGLGQLPLTPVFEGNSTSNLNLSVPVPLPGSSSTKRGKGKGKGFSDLGSDMKRKSFNLFKRSVVVQDVDKDSSNTKTNAKVNANTNEKKLLSVTTSFTNLRKAANSLSRPKSTYDFSRSLTSFDTNTNTNTITNTMSKRPGSSGQQSESLSGQTTGVGLRLQQQRIPVGPTMHNRGSILVETSAIQDDEVRRMTELAFLG